MIRVGDRRWLAVRTIQIEGEGNNQSVIDYYRNISYFVDLISQRTYDFPTVFVREKVISYPVGD